jgi:hypothetical protein
MVGKSKDPKGTRITVRISDKDLADLQSEARRKGITVGAVVRTLIREHLPGTAPDVGATTGEAPPESAAN